MSVASQSTTIRYIHVSITPSMFINIIMNTTAVHTVCIPTTAAGACLALYLTCNHPFTIRTGELSS